MRKSLIERITEMDKSAGEEMARICKRMEETVEKLKGHIDAIREETK